MSLIKEINQILQSYDIGEFKKYKLVYKEWNTSYKIKTTNGDYLLKILNFQNEKELKSELEIVKRLKDKVPISFPILTKNNRLFLEYKKKIVLIYKFLNGKPALRGEKLPDATLKELGRYYAIIHKTRNISGIQKKDLFEQVSSFFDKINKNSKEYNIYKKTIGLLEKNGFNPKELPRGLIHADLHTENVLFNKWKIIVLLDFEESHVGAFIYDLGICVLDTCWKNNSLSGNRIKTFINGYESVRKLTQAEKVQFINSALFAGLYTLYFSVKKNGVGKKQNINHYVIKRFLKLLQCGDV